MKISKEDKKKLCRIEGCSKKAKYIIDLSKISELIDISEIDNIYVCSKRHLRKILKKHRREYDPNTFEIMKIGTIEVKGEMKQKFDWSNLSKFSKIAIIIGYLIWFFLIIGVTYWLNWYSIWVAEQSVGNNILILLVFVLILSNLVFLIICINKTLSTREKTY